MSYIASQRGFKFEGRLYQLPGNERITDLLNLSPIQLRNRFNDVNEEGIPLDKARSLLTTAYTNYLNQASSERVITEAQKKARLQKWKIHVGWPRTFEDPLWCKNHKGRQKSIRSLSTKKSGHSSVTKPPVKPPPGAPLGPRSGLAQKGISSSKESAPKSIQSVSSPVNGPILIRDDWVMPRAPNCDLQDVSLQFFYDLFCEANPQVYGRSKEWDVILDCYEKYVQMHFGANTLRHVSAALTGTKIGHLIPREKLEKHLRQLPTEDQQGKKRVVTNPVNSSGYINEAAEFCRKRLRGIDVFGSPEPCEKQIKMEDDENDTGQPLHGAMPTHAIAVNDENVQAPKVKSYHTVCNRTAAPEEENSITLAENVMRERPSTTPSRTRAAASRPYSPSMPNIMATKPTFLGSESFAEETHFSTTEPKGAATDNVQRVVDEFVASVANASHIGIQDETGDRDFEMGEAATASGVANEEDTTMVQQVSPHLGSTFTNGNRQITVARQCSRAFDGSAVSTRAGEPSCSLPGKSTSAELLASPLVEDRANWRLFRLETLLRGGLDDLDVTLQAMARLSADWEQVTEHVQALISLRYLHRAALKEVHNLEGIVGGGST